MVPESPMCIPTLFIATTFYITYATVLHQLLLNLSDYILLILDTVSLYIPIFIHEGIFEVPTESQRENAAGPEELWSPSSLLSLFRNSREMFPKHQIRTNSLDFLLRTPDTTSSFQEQKIGTNRRY